MSHVLILLNKWANYFSLLKLSIRQKFDKMWITTLFAEPLLN